MGMIRIRIRIRWHRRQDDDDADDEDDADADDLIFCQHYRMFASYPGTKTYFSHLDISPGSEHLLSHGKKIVLAIAEGSKDISQLTVTLAPLQTLHAYQLRIDPTNFKVLKLRSRRKEIQLRKRLVFVFKRTGGKHYEKHKYNVIKSCSKDSKPNCWISDRIHFVTAQHSTAQQGVVD